MKESQRFKRCNGKQRGALPQRSRNWFGTCVSSVLTDMPFSFLQTGVRSLHADLACFALGMRSTQECQHSSQRVAPDEGERFEDDPLRVEFAIFDGANFEKCFKRWWFKRYHL